MAVVLEEVHQGLTDQCIFGLEAEELEPGRVDADNDAFLGDCNGVGRTIHQGLHLLAILRGRQLCVLERTLQLEGAQLARHDCLEPTLMNQRHDILRARGEILCDDLFVDLPAYDQQRHARCAMITRDDGARDVAGKLIGEVQNHLRGDLHQPIRKIVEV